MPKSSSRKILQGDRVKPFGGGTGTITAVKKGLLKYFIKWDNGRTDNLTTKEFNDWCEVLPPDATATNIQEEELANFDQPNLDFSREQGWKVGDRAIDPILGEVEIIDVRDEMVKGRTSDNCDPWLSPAGTKVLQPCLPNEIFAQVSAQDTPYRDSNLDLPLLAYASAMTSAEASLPSDSQAFLLTPTSEAIGEAAVMTLQPSVRPVNHSAFRESDSVQTTLETASPQSSKSSCKTSRNSSRSKTSKACSLAPTDQATECDISLESSPSFPSAGTMQSGLWSAVEDTTEPPGLEKGYFWLDSPGALSSRGRSPGQDKLQSSMKANGLINVGECLNPRSLEKAFNLPLDWTNPLESRTAAQLLADAEKHSATVSTLELQQSHSSESSISTASLKMEEELTPVDESAVGKHYWCDRLTVAVTVLSVEHLGAVVQPWWQKENGRTLHKESFLVYLRELVELEEFSCEINLQPSNSLEKPKTQEKKFDFYVTVPAGIERPSLMPNDLCFLFVASSFWNRSRAKNKSFPRYPHFPVGARTAADAGGYIAARDWEGKYPYTPAQYVEWLLGWCNGWAATMDYCCEPPLTGGDRKKIRHRQKQTTRLAWLFWNKYRDVSWQWVPTIQGWDTEDYIRHACELKPLIQEMRSHYGEPFRVGIGTLCSRTSNSQIQEIVEAVSAILPKINFHLWGVKQDAASILKLLPQVISCDSAAWDGLAGSRCRKIWEEEYRGQMSQAEYRWTVALPKYLNSLEKKLGVSLHNLGNRPNSLEKPETHTTKQTGSIYQYTANRAGKDGVRREYPLVEGRERDRAEDSDWYWGISYVEKENGKWKDKSASIPSCSLSLARQLMRERFPLSVTLEASKLKWIWQERRDEYLFGEVRPEKCPRLAVLSFEERQIFVIGPTWGEATPIYRQRKREELVKAIAEGKPFAYIKEILT